MNGGAQIEHGITYHAILTSRTRLPVRIVHKIPQLQEYFAGTYIAHP
jgi:hypothetical protein